VPGYQIVKCLGQGAYGEVWLATQQNNPAHRVAIKFYTGRGGDWSSPAREVEKLNILTTDRYIVQLLDVGWDANPPYYVMEHLENGSLAKRLERLKASTGRYLGDSAASGSCRCSAWRYAASASTYFCSRHSIKPRSR
jgi:serine/threonine protein kinase